MWIQFDGLLTSFQGNHPFCVLWSSHIPHFWSSNLFHFDPMVRKKESAAHRYKCRISLCAKGWALFNSFPKVQLTDKIWA